MAEASSNIFVRNPSITLEPAMSELVSWNLRVSIRQDQLEAFRTLMQEMVTSTEAESGTLGYELFISSDDTECHIHERYANSAGALAHLGHFGSRFAERFLGCVEPTSILVYGEPSDEVRTILDGFGAIYFGTLGGFSR